jgi:hypothetical protein
MDTDPDTDPGASSPPADPLMGSLPRTRPAVRTRRRPDEPKTSARRDPVRVAAAKRRAGDASRPETPEPPKERPAGRGRTLPGPAGDVEALARAGVGTALAATGMGLKAGRWAARTLRSAIERD